MLKKAALVFAILLAAVALLLRFLLAPFIKNKLTDAVSSGSNGLYSLEMQEVYCNPLTGFASFGHVRLRTDTVLLEKLRVENPEKAVLRVDLQVGRLEVADARFYSSWSTKAVDLGNVTLFDPVIDIYTRLDSLILRDTVEVAFLERLPEILCAQLKSVRINRLKLDNASLNFSRRDSRKYTTMHKADSIAFVLDSIFVEKNTRTGDVETETGDLGGKKDGGKDIDEKNTQSGVPQERNSGLNIKKTSEDRIDSAAVRHALYARKIDFSFKNYTFETSKSPYVFAVGSGTYSSREDVIELTGVSAGPNIGDEEFIRRQKFRRGRMRIQFPLVRIARLDLYKALHKDVWIMETVELNRGKVDVYINKSVEHVPDKRMPHELIRDLDFYLRADSIFARNVDIIYHEKKPDGKGVITFDQSYVKITNFTNDSLRMTDAHPVLIDATCRLMNEGKLDVTVRLPLLSRDFACSYRAALGPMAMPALNPLFEKDNLIIEAGMLKGVKMQASVHNGKAGGMLEATYDDLKIKVIEAVGTGKKPFLSSLANMLLHKKNKSKHEPGPARTGTIAYERIPGDDFLRYLWRSARSGLLDILLPEGVNVPLPPDHPTGVTRPSS